MSAKLKIVLVLILSIFATAAVGTIVKNRQPSTPVSMGNNPGKITTPDFASIKNQGQSQQSPVAIQTLSHELNPERARYQAVPLDSIKSTLKGTDPASLAMDAFDTPYSEGNKSETRKVEVVYPQPNQALVTITRTDFRRNPSQAVRYRVELSRFGRTLLVSSPPMWQIVWAGTQEKCGQNKC
jgi:hypothetical protein